MREIFGEFRGDDVDVCEANLALSVVARGEKYVGCALVLRAVFVVVMPMPVQRVPAVTYSMLVC